jgi:hypothetical protein
MIQNFPFENLSDEEFENLAIRISNELLGIAAKTFSIGPDEGKDSWFNGKASRFPSEQNSWNGEFLIQAKHTKRLNASCSDSDFGSKTNQNSVLNKEIARLKEVQKNRKFDCYLIFTNRKLSGEAHGAILTWLQQELGIENVDIIGREQLNAYLEDYPHIAERFGLNKFFYPLRFYEKDLREVILVFAEQSQAIAKDVRSYIQNFAMINKEEKNRLNNLSEEYFEFIKRHSLQYFEEIERFLKDPKNDRFTRYYANTISDLQEAIILERDRFNEFEHVIKHLIDYVVRNNEEKLKDLRRIVRVFIHFMYFNCDLGKTK